MSDAAVMDSCRELLEASGKGDVKQMESIFERQNGAIKPFLNTNTWRTLDSSGDTPLHRAARGNKVEALQFLWPRLATKLSRCENNSRQTPVHSAALSNAIDAVVFMLEKQRSLVHFKEGECGRTVLHHAAQKGHFELVKVLVERFGANLFCLSVSNGRQDTPVHLAAYFGHLPIVHYMVEAAPKLEELLPMHAAALGGQLAIVEYFLSNRGQSIELVDESTGNRTVLHKAASMGHLQLVKALVENFSADMFAREADAADLPIHLAACFGHLPVIKYFLAVERRLERTRNAEQQLPIHRAAFHGQVAVVEYFLARRPFSVDSRDSKFGRTLLHMAATGGHLKLVQLLAVKFRANIRAKSKTSDREDLPIHLAAYFGHLPVVKYFLEADVSLVAARNLLSKTPLQCAQDGVRNDKKGAAAVATFLHDLTSVNIINI